MKIIGYQCGCIAVRFPGQIEVTVFRECPATAEGRIHAVVVATVEDYVHLGEVEQCDYGYCINKLMLDGRQMRMVRRLISGEYI